MELEQIIIGDHNFGAQPSKFMPALEQIAEAADDTDVIIKDITIAEHD